MIHIPTMIAPTISLPVIPPHPANRVPVKFDLEETMSNLHTLGYDALRDVERAMQADRNLRAVKTYTQYSVDKDSGVVVPKSDPNTLYLAQYAQQTLMGTYWHGCTCMDVQTHITNLDRRISFEAKKLGVPEAQDMHSTCQCKHSQMRKLAAGLPLFVYTGSQRWMVRIKNGKPYWSKSKLFKTPVLVS